MNAANRSHFVYVTFIRTTPAKLWQALTEPQFIRQYWFGTTIECAWQKGAPWKMFFPDGRPTDSGEILEIDPPRRLVHTFSATWDKEVAADAPHTVAWSIEPMGAACRVSCEHWGFAGDTATYRSVSGGLSLILNGMKTLLETGEPLSVGR